MLKLAAFDSHPSKFEVNDTNNIIAKQLIKVNLHQ